jgi:decaprenylphospho-beta-D-ribofuranose 2-oxidase
VATSPTRQLSGWGRTAPSTARVPPPPTTAEELTAAFGAAATAPEGRGVLARGLGRSYGDAAQNAGGVVLEMTSLARVHRIDADAATAEVDAGVSLDRLLRLLFPLGLTVPVLPGTRQVTVGGAIACDVHGKNHHVDGSFGRHVVSLDLLTADGRVRTVRQDGPDQDLFWATVGGLGLTGLVLRATLSLRRVETSYVVSSTERAHDLDAVMTRLTEEDQDHPYSVAWFDSVSRGRLLGRGLVMHGRDATVEDLPRRHARRPLRLPSDRTVTVPDHLPSGLVNRVSGRAFNEVWFRKAPRVRTEAVVPAFGFFHPLDAVAEWNRVYGPRGLCQYQLVVPFGAEDVVRRVVERIAATGHVSCLNVLKRFGPGSPAPMSFPMPGWTLAVDLPVRPGLGRLLAELDALVLGAGGRVYLAKDSRLDPAALPAMYPRLAEFRAVLDRVDPQGRFVSDLSRRLGLRPGPNRIQEQA